jgi:hypothetical protein
MKKPDRIEGAKYQRIVVLSENIMEKRPAEGEVINKLILHVNELYEYIDYIENGGDDGTMDDDALRRLGVDVPKEETGPARTRTRRRSRTRRNFNGGWQAEPTDLSYLDGLDFDV